MGETKTFKLDEQEIEVLKHLLAEREETEMAIKADRGRVFLEMLNKLEGDKK